MEILARVWSNVIDCTCIRNNNELIEFTIPLDKTRGYTYNIRKYFDKYLMKIRFLHFDALNNEVLALIVKDDFIPSTYVRSMGCVS